MIYQDYVLRMLIELIKQNGFTLKKKKGKEKVDEIQQKQ